MDPAHEIRSGRTSGSASLGGGHGRRGWAIAAGYVAIVAAFCWLLAPIALGMGVWALVDIKRHGGLGQGRAWFAIATGGVGTLLLLLIVAFSIAQP